MKKLPDNWQLSRSVLGWPVLHRWETNTVGHLWWKHEVSDWRYIRSFTFARKAEIVEWAIQTETILRAEGRNFYEREYVFEWFQGPGSL